MIVSRLMARNDKPRDVAGFLDLDQITVGGNASTRAAVAARRQWQSPMRSEQPLRSGAGLVQVVASKHDAILADTAEARVGRPLRQRALPALAGGCIGAHTAARLQELRSELLPLALLLGGRMSTRRMRTEQRSRDLDPRRPTAPDLRSPQQPLMAAGLWLRPRTRLGLGDREACHGEMVQNRIE